MLSKLIKSTLVTFLCLVILFFGLTGSFFSEVFGIEKFHYYCLLPSFFILYFLVFRLKHTPILVFLALFFLISEPLRALNSYPNYSNALLASFSVFLMPLIFYSAGKELNINQFLKGMNVLALIFFLGFVLEFTNLYPDLFPYIGYELNGEVKRRYGSFAYNSLGLGYFSIYSIFFCFLNANKFIRYSTLFFSLILLAYANSRACYAIFLLSVCVYFLLSKNSRIASLCYLISIISLLLFLLPFSSRLLSIFDWSNDRGNLGRIFQWETCVKLIPDNLFWGVGAGSFSPFGGDLSPTGLIKSCESFPLMLVVEYGFFMTMFYLVMLFKCLDFNKNDFRGLANKPELQFRIYLFVSVNLGFLIGQLVNQSLEGVFLGGMFFMLSGYIRTNIVRSAAPLIS